MRYSWIFGIVLVLALVTVAACGSASTPTVAATPTAIPSSTLPALPTSTSAPSPAELRSTILAAFRSLEEKSFRQRSDTTVLSDGKTYNTMVEFVAPDRYHIVSAPIEYVILGQKVYIKQNDVWTESQIPAASIVGNGYSKGLEESISDIQFMGADSLNGKPMQVYQYQNKTKIGDADSTAQSKVWIGVEDHLPYKMVMDGETASLDSSTGKVVGVKSTATISFEYDPAIKIDLPLK